MPDIPPEKPDYLRGRTRSFSHAWRGIRALIRTQANAQLHLAATIGVITLGLFSNLNDIGWVALLLAIGLVWLAEAMNTAIELLADRLCSEHDERIGLIKDIAAGAVLLASIAAAAVGLIVFL